MSRDIKETSWNGLANWSQYSNTIKKLNVLVSAITGQVNCFLVSLIEENSKFCPLGTTRFQLTKTH